MAVSGVALMMRSLGVDPEKLRESIEAFMATMTTAAATINANQKRIEENLGRIERQLAAIEVKLSDPGETTELAGPDGRSSGVLLTTEKFPDAMLRDVRMLTAGSE
jgi:hypothetical protein